MLGWKFDCRYVVDGENKRVLGPVLFKTPDMRSLVCFIPFLSNVLISNVLYFKYKRTEPYSIWIVPFFDSMDDTRQFVSVSCCAFSIKVFDMMRATTFEGINLPDWDELCLAASDDLDGVFEVRCDEDLFLTWSCAVVERYRTAVRWNSLSRASTPSVGEDALTVSAFEDGVPDLVTPFLMLLANNMFGMSSFGAEFVQLLVRLPCVDYVVQRRVCAKAWELADEKFSVSCTEGEILTKLLVPMESLLEEPGLEVESFSSPSVRSPSGSLRFHPYGSGRSSGRSVGSSSCRPSYNRSTNFSSVDDSGDASSLGEATPGSMAPAGRAELPALSWMSDSLPADSGAIGSSLSFENRVEDGALGTLLDLDTREIVNYPAESGISSLGDGFDSQDVGVPLTDDMITGGVCEMRGVQIEGAELPVLSPMSDSFATVPGATELDSFLDTGVEDSAFSTSLNLDTHGIIDKSFESAKPSTSGVLRAHDVGVPHTDATTTNEVRNVGRSGRPLGGMSTLVDSLGMEALALDTHNVQQGGKFSTKSNYCDDSCDAVCRKHSARGITARLKYGLPNHLKRMRQSMGWLKSAHLGISKFHYVDHDTSGDVDGVLQESDSDSD